MREWPRLFVYDGASAEGCPVMHAELLDAVRIKPVGERTELKLPAGAIVFVQLRDQESGRAAEELLARLGGDETGDHAGDSTQALPE